MNFIRIFFLIFVQLGIGGCAIDIDVEDRSKEFKSIDFSASSPFDFDANFVELENGEVRLKPLDFQTSGNEFLLGNHVGSVMSSSGTLTLGQKESQAFSLDALVLEKRENLIGYWKLDGSSTDSSGQGHHGIDQGALSYTMSSILGEKAGQFNGVDSFFEVENSPVFSDLPNQLSISAWVQWNSKVNFMAVVNKSSKLLVNTDKTFRLSLDNSTDQKLRIQVGTDNGFFSTSSLGPMPLSTWTHVGVSYDGKKLRLYVNGVFQSETTVTGKLLNFLEDTNTITVGTLNYDATLNRILDGYLDEVGIWNTSLTGEEIEKIYFEQSQKFSGLSSRWTPRWTDLVGYWPLDGNFEDFSGRGLHGSPAGSLSISSDAKVGRGAGEFNGTSDFFTVPHDSSLASENFSISHWIKKEGPVNNGHSIGVIASRASGALTPLINYETRVFEGSQFASIRVGDGSGTTACHSQTKIEDDRWYHLLFTGEMIGPDFQIKVFINGQLDESCLTPNFSPYTGGTSDMFVGVWFASSNFGYFPGKVDDLAIWKSPLTPGEALRVYNRQKQKYVGHYDSRVLETGLENFNWSGLSWLTSLPFGKGLIGDLDGDGAAESESSTSYPSLEGGLGVGLQGYWPLNEGALNLGPGGVDFNDFSGKENHGEETNNVVPGAQGRLALGAQFNGLDERITIASSPSLEIADTLTVSFWAKLSTENISSSQLLGKIAFGTAGWGIGQNASSGKISVRVDTDLTANSTLLTNKVVFDGEWHHILFTLDSGERKIFIDGSLDTSDTYNHGSGFSNGSNLIIGTFGTIEMSGVLDEVAIWNRVLSSHEVSALYRRGGNRVHVQVKSCVDAGCNCKSFNTSPVGNSNDCDGDGVNNSEDVLDAFRAEFIGPGGDGATGFSELINRQIEKINFSCAGNFTDSLSNICYPDEIFYDHTANEMAPRFSLDTFPSGALIRENPYFQYRVTLEADDNLSCSGAPCLPDIHELGVNSSQGPFYYGQVQLVTSRTPLPFEHIHGATLEADDCVQFQISNDGTQFYILEGRSWSPASNLSQGVSEKALEENVKSFSTQVGSGNFYLRALLRSDGNTPCGFREFQLDTSQLPPSD